jgi:hypothetical protein
MAEVIEIIIVTDSIFFFNLAVHSLHLLCSSELSGMQSFFHKGCQKLHTMFHKKVKTVCRFF